MASQKSIEPGREPEPAFYRRSVCPAVLDRRTALWYPAA